MDYISHGLWSYIFFYKIKKPVYAVLFGLLPDTFSWGVYAFYNLIFLEEFGEPVLGKIPQWVFTLYNITHSLIIVGVLILLIYLILKKIPIYIFAWPIAIIMDIFTHTRDFLPTPFLWPISGWKFPGISFANPIFLLINYSVLLTLLTYIIIKKRQKKINNEAKNR